MEQTIARLVFVVALILPAASYAYDESKYVDMHQVGEPSPEDFLNGTHGKSIEYETGDLLSGNGKWFSPWYKFVTPAAPKGYKVLKSDLWVTGDRPVAIVGDVVKYSKANPPEVTTVFPMGVKRAGAWMEYMLFEKTPDHVVWGIDLQGHEDIGSKATVTPKYNFSSGQGSLEVVFERSVKIYSATSRAHVLVTYERIKPAAKPKRKKK